MTGIGWTLALAPALYACFMLAKTDDLDQYDALTLCIVLWLGGVGVGMLGAAWWLS